MTWQEAVDWKKYMLQAVTGSVLIPQYGFSLWTFPYLLSQGLSLQQIIDFARDTTAILLKSLPDQDIDLSEDIASMAQHFYSLRALN